MTQQCPPPSKRDLIGKTSKIPSYIDLSTPHIISTRKGGTLTSLARKRLEEYLAGGQGKWEDKGAPYGPKGMDLCHACNCDTHHGGCVNPKHTYWCSRSENMADLASEKNPRGKAFRAKMRKIALDR